MLDVFSFGSLKLKRHYACFSFSFSFRVGFLLQSICNCMAMNFAAIQS